MGNVTSHSSKMNLKDASIIHSKRKQKNKEIKEFFNLKKFSPNCLLNFLRYKKRINFLKIESTILNLKEEKKDIRIKIVEQIRGNPLVIGTLEEFIDEERCIVTPNNGLEFAVPIMSFVDSAQLKPGSSVLLNYRDSVVVGICNNKTVLNIKVEHNPTETYDIIGGLDDQIREIKESVELPLVQPELFTNMGIEPPKGVLLYGEPGTGKTLLAKAVANATSASFFRINGSELIKKYLGEGPKLVRDIFKNAIDEAPSIIFIDEIDAVGHRRVESGSSGMREIQRTMVELLNQLDGFDKNNNVKVIMATNRIDSLDPALIRPGRIDRKIYFPVPNKIMREKIFSIYLKKMSISREVNIKKLAEANLSGADIKALCTEAGMNALRKRNMEISMVDFENAMFKIKRTEGVPPLLYS